jgi:hypothetical protein
MGDAVQPSANILYGAGLAHEQEKGRLADVLGVVWVVQQLPADAQNHRPVPPQQLGKRLAVAVLYETGEQILVARLLEGVGRRQAADVAQDGIGSV